MVYGINAYKDSLSSDTKSISTIYSEEFSLFSFGIDCLTENDMELRNILTASRIDTTVVNEPVGSTFISLIKTIIKGFLKILNKIFDTFKDAFYQIFQPKSAIDRYKKDLLNYKYEFDMVTANFTYHNYSHFQDDIPSPDLYLWFTEDYEYSVKELQKIAKLRTKNEILTKIAEITRDVDTNIDGKFYCTARANILNVDEVVPAEGYAEKLYAFFRSGESKDYISSDKVGLHVTSAMVKASAERWFDYKPLKDKLKKQKAKLESSANSVIMKFEKLNYRDYIVVDNKFDYDFAASFEAYGTKKAGQLSELCNICIMAYSAKLDAVKEAAIQDRAICIRALSRIISGRYED